MILRELEDIEETKSGGYNCNNLRYADDTVLIASSEKDLQRMINVISKESVRMGLSLNAKKSECMNVSKNKHPSPCKVHIDGEPMRQVKKKRITLSGVARTFWYAESQHSRMGPS